MDLIQFIISSKIDRNVTENPRKIIENRVAPGLARYQLPRVLTARKSVRREVQCYYAGDLM